MKQELRPGALSLGEVSPPDVRREDPVFLLRDFHAELDIGEFVCGGDRLLPGALRPRPVRDLGCRGGRWLLNDFLREGDSVLVNDVPLPVRGLDLEGEASVSVRDLESLLCHCLFRVMVLPYMLCFRLWANAGARRSGSSVTR